MPPSSVKPATSKASASTMRCMSFPNYVAVYNERFAFTTLSPAQLERVKGNARYAHPQTRRPCHLFTLDEITHYLPFAKDFGPLNQANVFQACTQIHYVMTDATERNPVCLYTTNEPKQKSNIALAVALYFVVIGGVSPWDAFRPIAEMEVRPFRDAGNGIMDWGLHIQDCLVGIRKAIDFGLIDFAQLDIPEYKYYEQVCNGDLNLLGPFIPFASPIEPIWTKSAIRTINGPGGIRMKEILTVERARTQTLSHAFRCVLALFRTQQVGLVVRLNDELYDKRHFLAAGMNHVEMYFDDGSNPTDQIVRDFIQLSEEVIELQGQKVAVHCKAGLGRTGVLIGAYLIYKYGFSAQEVIGYMRIVRPGMVVGPQQQYMVENQLKWAGWAARDAILRELNTLPLPSSLHTPPLEDDATLPLTSPLPGLQPLSPAMSARTTKVVAQTTTTTTTATYTPVIKGGDAAGQPRKTPRPIRGEAYVEVHTPITEEVDMLETMVTPTRLNPNTYRETDMLSSAPTSPGLDGSRGVKRGSGRTPVTATRHVTALDSPHVPSLTIPRSPARPSSTFSVQSEADDRPSKRRPIMSSTIAPLTKSNLAPHGLTSPPPSRGVSADPDIQFIAENPPPCPSPPPPTQHSAPAASSPPRAAHGVLHPITIISNTPPSKTSTRRNFLSSKKSQSALKDTFPSVKEVRVPAVGSTTPGKHDKGATGRPVSHSTPKREHLREDKKNRGLTPPRFGFGMGGILGRKGSNTQA